MIAIKVLNGPRAGETIFNTEIHDPQELFSQFLEKGIAWDVDYKQATIGERKDWGSWDLVSRCARALANGREVYFLGKIYKKKSNRKKSFEKVATELEIAISTCKKWIIIQKDDEKGMIIDVMEPTKFN